MLFAFSRDRAVPGWKLWSTLSKNRVPANGVILSAVIAALITLPALVTVLIPINGADVPTPVAFFAVVSIGVVGLYLAFAIPIFLRWRQGDEFKVGSWNLGKNYKWMAPLALIEIADHLVRRALPDLAGRGAVEPRVRVEVRELHAVAGRRGVDPAVDLLAPLGEEVVHRADQPGRYCGNGAMSEHNPEAPVLLSVDALTGLIADGEIDTVVVAFTDMQGRLQGKRLHAPFFADEVLAHGTEGCNYLLSVDVDMNTVPGTRCPPGTRATAT